jgi:peptidoglycan/LPS O-acetylase OafA/YrhL
MLAFRTSGSALFGAIRSRPFALPVAAAGALALLFGREFVPVFRDYGWMHYGLLAAALPFIFHATDPTQYPSRLRRLDAGLGNLSYPVYILHMPLIYALKTLGWYSHPAAFAATLLSAVIVRQAVEAPVDRWRHSRLKKAAA